MSYRIDKDSPDKDIVISSFELGIGASPHKGIGNIQNANLATEVGEVMASYGRFQNSMTNSTANGTLNFNNSSTVTLSISATNNHFKGQWISVSSSSHTGELANGTYYVQDISTGSNAWSLSTTYSGSTITGFTAGLTAVITLFRNMSQPIAYTTETYVNGTSTFYRYYILDSVGLVWMYDTINDLFPSDDVSYWVLPDTSITYFGSDTNPSGLGVLNGWLIVMSGNKFWVKPTVNLGSSYVQMTNAYMMSLLNSGNIHYGLVGHQGRMYYTDGDFIGSIFPDTSLEVSGLPNIQSYASYTTSTTTGTISQLLSGSVPSDGNVSSTLRVPAVFFAATGGTPPTALTANVVFYIAYALANANFQVFAAESGGSPLDITTGASGTQYFNTFFPVGTHATSAGDHPLMVFSPQRCNLPVFERSQCLAEVGNTVMIGAKGSVIYPWNQVDATPSGLINLPESDTKQILTVNQMAYIFTGSKGNVYITDGSVASLVIKLPDFCAGIAGTASTYFEPNFVWGGVAYIRGRVYFSVLDQTSTKAGNCGGVWSFIPTQNLYIGQDTGLSLRLENQNSYGSYNGYSTVLIPWFNQNIAKSPQYWSGWVSSLSSPVYGIDQTSTSPLSVYSIETDLIPVGTFLNKYTPKQIEYKLAAALVAGETVQIYWRKNGTDAYQSCGAVFVESTTGLSGYFNANFQGAQWVQFQIIGTPLFNIGTSFVRLSEIRIR